jgi:hypothetical protein
MQGFEASHAWLEALLCSHRGYASASIWHQVQVRVEVTEMGTLGRDGSVETDSPIEVEWTPSRLVGRVE